MKQKGTDAVEKYLTVMQLVEEEAQSYYDALRCAELMQFGAKEPPLW